MSSSLELEGMVDHKIRKPNLFISHTSSDGEFARVLQAEIEKVFAGGVQVFCTSSPGTIGVSQDWLAAVEEKLETCQAVIVIVTPLSIERPWVWFEVGASWLRARSGKVAIYPLCAPEIDASQLPSPLDRLQALSMGKATDLKLLFEGLIKQFGFGKISSFRASNISKRIPKYKDVKIKEADLLEYQFYDGRYTGYSDEELEEVIVTELVSKEIQDIVNYPTIHRDRESSLYRGKLIHFRQLDRRLDLPPGTAKRLLKDVAAKYGLETQLEKEHIIRFEAADWFLDQYGIEK
ncbi:toll/interleukin-1 receptor domain-containing protein [Leptothoe sp. ISB3NOV94-8A]